MAGRTNVTLRRYRSTTVINYNVRQATTQDAEWMQESFKQMGWSKSDNYFADCCRQQEEGKLVLLVAEMEGTYVGHVKVVWRPGYPYFRQNGIPVINDLAVLPHYRRQGVATSLLDRAEAIIRTRSQVAGISFGLYADYGLAQRMYILRGYVPDGQGVSYDDEYVQPGQQVMVDDNLTLGLIKQLK